MFNIYYITITHIRTNTHFLIYIHRNAVARFYWTKMGRGKDERKRNLAWPCFGSFSNFSIFPINLIFLGDSKQTITLFSPTGLMPYNLRMRGAQLSIVQRLQVLEHLWHLRQSQRQSQRLWHRQRQSQRLWHRRRPRQLLG